MAWCHDLQHNGFFQDHNLFLLTLYCQRTISGKKVSFFHCILTGHVLYSTKSWHGFFSPENVSVIVDCPVFKQCRTTCFTFFFFIWFAYRLSFCEKTTYSLSVLLLFYNALCQWQGFFKAWGPMFPKMKT